jgi:hypothetical protein
MIESLFFVNSAPGNGKLFQKADEREIKCLNSALGNKKLVQKVDEREIVFY